MIIFFFCLIIISVLGYLSLIVKTAIRIGLGNKASVNKGNVAMNWLLLAFFVIGIYGAIFFPPNLISNKTKGDITVVVPDKGESHKKKSHHDEAKKSTSHDEIDTLAS